MNGVFLNFIKYPWTGPLLWQLSRLLQNFLTTLVMVFHQIMISLYANEVNKDLTIRDLSLVFSKLTWVSKTLSTPLGKSAFIWKHQCCQVWHAIGRKTTNILSLQSNRFLQKFVMVVGWGKFVLPPPPSHHTEVPKSFATLQSYFIFH